MKRFYKFKFYLNALHSVNYRNIDSDIHPHTWEIVVKFPVAEGNFINFTQFEKVLKEFLGKYEGKYLNEFEEFKMAAPTMENLGEMTFKKVEEILTKYFIELDSVEISENPTRTYIIEN